MVVVDHHDGFRKGGKIARSRRLLESGTERGEELGRGSFLVDVLDLYQRVREYGVLRRREVGSVAAFLAFVGKAGSREVDVDSGGWERLVRC